jgi:hypothetical protein
MVHKFITKTGVLDSLWCSATVSRSTWLTKLEAWQANLPSALTIVGLRLGSPLR